MAFHVPQRGRPKATEGTKRILLRESTFRNGLPSGEVFTKIFPSTVHTPFKIPSCFISFAIRTRFRRCAVKFSLMKIRFEDGLAVAGALGNSCEPLIFFNLTRCLNLFNLCRMGLEPEPRFQPRFHHLRKQGQKAPDEGCTFVSQKYWANVLKH